ncbi:MAG: flagellar hook-associated protein FlgK [Clostridiales bacterium]|jgi:flagellar hook-associated protein 1 FlgK|nr:flagellar hook-associated protein FlgK [Clostridiales bacterium]
MRSAFFEFNVAISGAFAARANLEVIGHNISNAAIPGYSRQEPLQKAGEPLPLYNGKGMVGTGSDAYGVERIRDAFLDTKYWTKHCMLGEYDFKDSQLTIMENVFNEMSEGAGLAESFDRFFAQASELATTSNDATYRTNLVQSADSLAQIINANAQALQKQQLDANTEFLLVVNEMNSIGEQIVSLNKQIVTYELDGSHANDLRDERTRLVDRLSELVNVTVYERSNNRYIVMINGYDFINHDLINNLKTIERNDSDAIVENNSKSPMDAQGLFDLIFAGTGITFDINSASLKGELRGIIDMRDGNGTGVVYSLSGDEIVVPRYKGVPYYMNKLNNLTRRFALAIDHGLYADGADLPPGTLLSDGITPAGYAQTDYFSGTPIQNVLGHSKGIDLNGQKLGTLMFTYAGGPTNGMDLTTTNPTFYNEMSCLNFIVNPNLFQDPSLLNCASTADNGSPSLGESANTVPLGMSLIKNNASLFREGKLLDYVVAINSELGIDSRQAKDFNASYTDLLSAIDNQRTDVSGVDINEEMVRMVKCQQLYQASAKLVSTINSIYDTLINRLGA